MDKFRIRGGDFIGIVIPGTILLFNLYLLFHENIEKPLKNIFGTTPVTITDNVILFVAFIVLSYTIGIVLRLLSPNNPDKLSSVIRISVRGLKNWLLREQTPFYGYRDKFPYFFWFIQEERHNMPDISHVFDKFAERDDIKNGIDKLYNKKDIIPSEANRSLPSNSMGMNYKDLMNYCKLFVMHNSVSLGEEVLFAEGFSRMVCGIFYSSLLSIILIIPALIGNHSSFPFVLLMTNLFIFAIITWGTRQIRVKEATIIFSSYGLLINAAENEKKGMLREM